MDVYGAGDPTWNDLSETLSHMEDGQILHLPCDMAAMSGDSSMLFFASSEKEITLDLNGHTLDAGEADNGFALGILEGMSLTITDSSADKSGKITGAHDNAAVVVMGGTITLEGGSISGTNRYSEGSRLSP